MRFAKITGLLAVALALHCAQAQAPARPYTALTTGPGALVVSRDGQDVLQVGLAMWGPNWAWTGFDGSVQAEQGAAVSAMTGKMGGTGAPFRVGFRATGSEAGPLEVTYDLQADADTGLTLAAVELAPGPAFEGQVVTVEGSGGSRQVPCPFGRREIGQAVSALRLTDKAGQVTVIRFDPPCDISADGAARLTLARDRLAAGQPRRLSLRIELPGALNWYPSADQVPDEPGIETWYPWQATGDPAPGMIGLGDWLDVPAGRYGRITRDRDRLMYHGQPLKLWGLNLSYGACAPEKPLADRRAAFYRKYGINAVRLHKYADGPGWSGIQAEDSCVAFDPAALDRMDYQVAQLKKAGIYVLLSAHFGTLKLGPADRQYVPWIEEIGAFNGPGSRVETPHSAIHYSPELQRVHIMQTVNLLKHRNPYTGLTYAEDPAVAFVEIINEQSILFYTSMNPLKASATLRGQVAARFCDWLRRRYGTQAALAKAWGADSFDIFEGDGFPAVGESLDKNNILPLGNPWYWDPAQINGSQAARKRRLLDTLEFLTMLQDEFYARYVKAVREAGYKGELVASNWQAGRGYSHYANLHSDALIGTVDRHNYFGGERASASMLDRPGSGLLSSGLQQVAGHPFMLSEWAHVFPNEMAAEGPAILGAYGMGLQGWDVSFMFQNGDEGRFSDRMGRSPWDPTAPPVLALFPAVARQVLRGDVQEAAGSARNVHVPSLYQGSLDFEDTVEQNSDTKELDSRQTPARALAAARQVVAFTPAPRPTTPFDMRPYEQNGWIAAAGRQLRWRAGTAEQGGCFTLNTRATAGVVGFVAGQRFALGPVTLEPQSRFAAIYVTARDRTGTLDGSRELLVVAMARARNTSMKFSPDGSRLLAVGKPPILMEPVKARITLRRPGAPKVLLLDHDGRPTDRTLPVVNGSFTLDGARDRTCYYLVTYAR